MHQLLKSFKKTIKTINNDKRFKKIINSDKKVYYLLLLFFIINLFTLLDYPFVHSDESWLSGLSRSILISGDFSAVESFFDLLPRNPHAVKIFFHTIQIIFIKILGYSIFSVRIISLIAAVISLYLFYKNALLISDSQNSAFLSAVVLSVDIHFIYSSHMARQEIILVMIFLAALYYFLKNDQEFLNEQQLAASNNTAKNDRETALKNHKLKDDILLALILGAAVGFHPNSFVIAMPFIFIYSFKVIFHKSIRLKNYLAFGITLAFSAGSFVFLSLKFDPNFFSNYAAYGERLGVLSSILTKIDRLDYFYQKIFYRVSGTYYIPPVKFQLIFFSLLLILSFILLFFKKRKINLYLFFSAAALNTAYIIIGRYNQTSIIFIFPVFYLMLLHLLGYLNSEKMIPKLNLKAVSAVLLILITISAFISIKTIKEDSFGSYQAYLENISEHVDSDQAVLANLNSEFYFDAGKLYDYRNLAYLDENNLSFADYIRKNSIEYIIYPEEMDFIYSRRPKWNILYGNLYPYYGDMQEFLQQNTELKAEFINSTYGIRIVRYIESRDWKVKIYRVKEEFLKN